MSRAERKVQRHAALIAGALDVLAEHGLEGFTTGRVAKAAGIGQSAFYLYFPDRNTCLEAVASHVGEQVLEASRAARRAVGNDPAQLSRSFAGALSALAENRAACELFLRFRREPGPIGDRFRALVERGVAELAADMVAFGMVRADDPAGPRLARYTVTLTLGALEALLDGDLADADTVADDLARIAGAVLTAGIA